MNATDAMVLIRGCGGGKGIADCAAGPESRRRRKTEFTTWTEFRSQRTVERYILPFREQSFVQRTCVPPFLALMSQGCSLYIGFPAHWPGGSIPVL